MCLPSLKEAVGMRRLGADQSSALRWQYQRNM